MVLAIMVNVGVREAIAIDTRLLKRMNCRLGPYDGKLNGNKPQQKAVHLLGVEPLQTKI